MIADAIRYTLITAIIVGGLCFALFIASSCEEARQRRAQENYMECMQKARAQECPCLCAQIVGR